MKAILPGIMILDGIGMLCAGIVDKSLSWLSYVGIGLIIIGIILNRKVNGGYSTSTTHESDIESDNSSNSYQEEHYYLDDGYNTEIFPCGYNEWQDMYGNRYKDDGYGNLYKDE